MSSRTLTALLLPCLFLFFLNGTAALRYNLDDIMKKTYLDDVNSMRPFGSPGRNDFSYRGARTQNHRRFLFSPTIQNTITNLNQNQNANVQDAKEKTDAKGPYVYRNPTSGVLEYDLRGKRPRKICFILE